MAGTLARCSRHPPLAVLLKRLEKLSPDAKHIVCKLGEIRARSMGRSPGRKFADMRCQHSRLLRGRDRVVEAVG